MKNIVLIGMPGAGKSTAGVLLAKSTGMAFVDTDLVIQDNEGRLLQEIIHDQGIDAFLRIEEKTILGLNVQKSVIATGGSVIYSPDAMRKLKENGIVVYLKVPYEEIEKRLKNITSRGVVMRAQQTLFELYQERSPLYEKYADKILDCSGMDMERVVQKLTELYKNYII